MDFVTTESLTVCRIGELESEVCRIGELENHLKVVLCAREFLFKYFCVI